MRAALAVGALLLLAMPSAAWAGGCCAASTTAVPTRIATHEQWLASVGVQTDITIGRWDGAGRLATSSLAEQAVITTLAAGYRWDKRGQIALTLPVWLQHKAVGEVSAWGGGPGDARLVVTWDPIAEPAAPPGTLGWPVPVFLIGARAPTGRAWHQAKGALGEDVTGLAGPALTLGVNAERLSVRTPYFAGVDADLGLEHGRIVPIVRASLGVGRSIGTQWNVLGTVRHVHTWTHGASSARTTAGARVIHGQNLRWRGWLGAEVDLPVPWLGKANQRQVSAGIGVAIVR